MLYFDYSKYSIFSHQFSSIIKLIGCISHSSEPQISGEYISTDVIAKILLANKRQTFISREVIHITVSVCCQFYIFIME